MTGFLAGLTGFRRHMFAWMIWLFSATVGGLFLQAVVGLYIGLVTPILFVAACNAGFWLSVGYRVAALTRYRTFATAAVIAGAAVASICAVSAIFVGICFWFWSGINR